MTMMSNETSISSSSLLLKPPALVRQAANNNFFDGAKRAWAEYKSVLKVSSDVLKRTPHLLNVWGLHTTMHQSYMYRYLFPVVDTTVESFNRVINGAGEGAQRNTQPKQHRDDDHYHLLHSFHHDREGISNYKTNTTPQLHPSWRATALTTPLSTTATADERPPQDAAHSIAAMASPFHTERGSHNGDGWIDEYRKIQVTEDFLYHVNRRMGRQVNRFFAITFDVGFTAGLVVMMLITFIYTSCFFTFYSVKK